MVARRGGIRIFFTIPNIFTLLNSVFGFLSILMAIRGSLLSAFILIVFAMISDGLDGLVARKLNAVTDLGRELDSLCDQVSFGVAPAVMLVVASNMNMLAVAVAIIYACFGALRLARFNIYGSKEFFEGLAIPAAAFFSGITILCLADTRIHIAIVLVLLAAILMVSSIMFPSAKTRDGVEAISITVIIGIIMFITLLLVVPASTMARVILWLIFSVSVSYVLASPLVFWIVRRKRMSNAG